MEKEMDAGNIISQREIAINDEDDTGNLFEKLSLVGRDLLMDTLPAIFAGENESIVQNEDEVTFSPMISKEQEKIDWTLTAREVFNHIRALRPAPGAYTILEDQRFKIWAAEVVEDNTSAEPGTIIFADTKEMYVACGEGSVLSLIEVQPSGKKRMPVANFLAGTQIEKATLFN